jgi:NAD(P)-dependent dehydrogenase (short-subunit alcohol dehydrogenase family)
MRTHYVRHPPRHIVITGASSGLGAGLARDYAAPGVSLLLLARRAVLLEEVAETCRARGAAVAVAALDVGAAEPLAALLRAADDADPIDLVIANAGIARPPGEAGAAAQIRTNLLGAVHTIEPLVPRMLARGHGRIAVVASVAGLRGLPDCPAYCASKAGLRIYGEALRARLAPSGIAVCVITPGFFASPMSRRWQGARPLLISGEAAVRRVRRGIDRRRGRIGFPWPLAALLRLLDLLGPRLGDAAVRRFRFQIADDQSCDRNASIRAK